MIKISIITPVYNGEKYIRSCIESVIDQNCDELEHVIIDGDSTDRTCEMIRAYQKDYSHIRLISEKDSGQSEAMNKGIKLARGEFLSFLNCDDFYEAGTLRRVARIVETVKKPALIVGNCIVWDNDGRVRSVNRPSELRFDKLIRGPHIHDIPMNPSAYFYHKSLHKCIGPYDPTDHFAMDIDFLLRAVQAAHLYYFDEVWGNFRWIEGTKTHKDYQEGRSHQRLKWVYTKHHRRRYGHDSLRYRIWFDFQGHVIRFFRYNLSRLLYFLKRPDEFRAYLKSKKIAYRHH